MSHSRPPPGGHSSIIFGDDISASMRQEPSPAASPKARTTSSIIGHGPDEVALPTPTKTGRRMAPNSHARTSLIFTDLDEVASVVSDASSESGSSNRNRKSVFDGAAGITSPKQTPKRPERRHIPGNAHRSSVIFGDDGQSSPVSAPPSRSKSPSILPYEDSPSPKYGRRKPEGIAPNFKSSFSLAHPREDAAAKEADTRARQSHARFKSSVILGDDSPPEPDFSPKKFGKVTGRRLIAPPGGSSNMSLAEFAGALPDADSTDRTVYKVDPSSMDAAGRTTGKHRIY
ncbi:hypothetical protein BC829DRAFT_156204 [Chytridium lagenaria]|nr:hypothetical protein BC829DRAFT_156204 [Chytridium lagenaria]